MIFPHISGQWYFWTTVNFRGQIQFLVKIVNIWQWRAQVGTSTGISEYVHEKWAFYLALPKNFLLRLYEQNFREATQSTPMSELSMRTNLQLPNLASSFWYFSPNKIMVWNGDSHHINAVEKYNRPRCRMWWITKHIVPYSLRIFFQIFGPQRLHGALITEERMVRIVRDQNCEKNICCKNVKFCHWIWCIYNAENGTILCRHKISWNKLESMRLLIISTFTTSVRPNGWLLTVADCIFRAYFILVYFSHSTADDWLPMLMLCQLQWLRCRLMILIFIHYFQNYYDNVTVKPV